MYIYIIYKVVAKLTTRHKHIYQAKPTMMAKFRLKYHLNYLNVQNTNPNHECNPNPKRNTLTLIKTLTLTLTHTAPPLNFTDEHYANL